MQETPSETAAPARSFAASLLRPTRTEFITRAGIVLWTTFNLVVLVLVWLNPLAHSVVGNYVQGALGWWTGRDIFGPGIDGFLYLPSFAILYSPFAILGEPWGDILWRIVSVGALTYAVWRAARLFLPARAFEVFATALLLILPAGSAALRNGQATTLMLALMLLGALAIAERRWWPAAIWLALALAVKPLAIVLLLLAGVLYWPLAGRLLLCVALVLLLPLIHPDPAAAWHLYGLCLAKLFTAATPDPRAWSDVTGVLSRIGVVASFASLTILRLVTALATLAVAYVAVRRQDIRIAALDLFALAVCYLMLMNPRTEENTYIMLAAVIAFFAALVWQRERRIGQALLLAALCAAMGTQAYGDWIYRPTVLWLKPLLCLGFLPFLIQSCVGRFFGAAPALSGRAGH